MALGAFNNPLITNLGDLVVTQIQSPNFVHGQSGWAIFKDGSAEFHDIILPSGQGISVFFSATQPVGAHNGDLWYDISNGLLLSQFQNGVWTQYQIGTGAIANGSIISSLIATGSITAELIAAGAIDGTTINGVTINGNTINASDIILAAGSNNAILIYANAAGNTQTFTTSGTWTCPEGVGTISVQAWGAGGGGGTGTANAHGGSGGGGGEYAAEPALAVSQGSVYAYTVPGSVGQNTAGGNAVFPGDTVTVTAHGGARGSIAGTTALGGHGSSNSVHFNGGNSNVNFGNRGSGGGGAGGPTGAGGNGHSQYGTGGIGNDPGGDGGLGGNTQGGSNGGAPGGAGGGGGAAGGSFNGGLGGGGRIVISYSSMAPTLLASIAPTAGTDTYGNAYPQGVALIGSITPPASQTGTAILYSDLPGNLRYINGSDGDSYSVGWTRNVIQNTLQITSTVPTTILGLNVASGPYRWKAMITYLGNQNAGKPVIGWDGNAVSTTVIGSYQWLQSGNTPIGAAYNGNATFGNTSGFTLSTSTPGVFTAEGWINFTGSGTFNIRGQEGTNGDSWAVAIGSYFEISPV